MIFLDEVRAVNSYTLSQVAEHATPTDCWMTIDSQVYDLTSFLPNHDDKLDIRSWCGRDATADFHTKAGRNKDHSMKADELLSGYLIGSLVTESGSNAVGQTSETVGLLSSSVRPVVSAKKYNVLLPLLATIMLYFFSLKLMPKPSHNFVWDSVLVLGLIPSFVFGMIMALDIGNFKLLYYHVEFSIIFGVSCILHLLYRFKVYLSQGKFMFRKKQTF